MSLEEDFGLDKILFIHHAVEAKIAQAGLELDQDETIKEILAKKP